MCLIWVLSWEAGTVRTLHNMGMILAFIGGLGTPELIAIVLVVFLLFGAKKLPELARGIGKSLGEFKKARSEFEDELFRSEQEAKTGGEKKLPDSSNLPPQSEPVKDSSNATDPQKDVK